MSGKQLARMLRCCLMLAGLFVCGGVAADQKPLWEFGMGAGMIAFQDYRGADTTHAYLLPVPYLYYRGKFLQADRNGVRGRLFNQDWIELNISGNATTPVRRNAARAGMPDLRSTLEVGPSLDLHLWKSADEQFKFDVRLPVRGVFTLQAPPHAIGIVSTPYAAIDVANVAGLQGWYLGALAGPLFGDHRYHDYFYTVAPQYATPQRPAYEAHAGYSGAQILASLSKRYPSFWVGAYVRHDLLQGAAFEESPLVKRNTYWSGGFGIAWIIQKSASLVEATE